MRKLSVFLVLSLPAWLALGLALAQEPSTGIIYAGQRQFRIPFKSDTSTQNLKQLQLFVSTDQGRTWAPSALVAPDQGHFRFLAERDGTYWFTVQTLDLQGKLYPPVLDGTPPESLKILRVAVDTQAPSVQLQPLPPRGGEVGVSWDIRDDNLDLALPDSLRLEYRLAGSVTWQPLPVSPNMNQFYFNPRANALVEVRLKARDRAGNLGDAATTVSLTGGGAPDAAGQAPPIQSALDPSNAPGDSERRLVGSKRVSLNYKLEQVGPSGISFVELWYTQDNRSWHRYPVKFGDEANKDNITFDVVTEGVYGITLLAKSGVGLGDRPPQVGDRPQLWIEVDTTKPLVQLHSVVVGTHADKGKLTVTWAARDKNLTKDPISLSYAKEPTGPWTPFAEKLPNTNRHVWTMPADGVPYQFHVRVEAADQAGNIGEAITENLVKVDLATPKVRILTVEPASK